MQDHVGQNPLSTGIHYFVQKQCRVPNTNLKNKGDQAAKKASSDYASQELREDIREI